MRVAGRVATLTVAVLAGVLAWPAAQAGAVAGPGAASGAALPAAAPSGSGTPSTVALPRPTRGAAALDALGAALPAAAAANGMSAARLSHLLRTDPSLWLDRSGRLYAVDPAPALPAAVAAAAPAAAPYPYSQTFLLHSRAGSKHTIYLDFDGTAVSGTAWNSSGLAAGTYPGFDLDGNPASFSTTEQDLVQSVWQRVSEDYAPFDVDVTTQDPGVAALTRTSATDDTFGARALISPSTTAQTALCGGACGGIAYIGTFNQAPATAGFYQPAWIFPQSLANSTKPIAEAISHEVGHNLGLNHDGTATAAYYTGQGAWAPIMGAGYYEPISQWSKGEYTGANNTEDDLAVIAAHGTPLLTDDHGNSATAATSLGSSSKLAGAGVITSSADSDWFSFTTTCTGTATASVTPAPTSPNLDAELVLFDGAGTALVTSNPASAMVSSDVASGLSASLSRSLAPGTYYLRVRGVGAGDPATTGYSSYASLGAYSVAATTAGSGCGMPVAEFFTSSASNFTVVRGGTWAASGGRYVLTAPASGADNGNLAVHATTVTGDFTLTALGSTTATSDAGNDFSVVVGYRDASNYDYVNFSESNGATTSGVFRVSGGVLTQLADITRTITAGTLYSVRVERVGTGIRVLLNGSVVATATDGGWTAGKVGFGSQNDGGQFDELVVHTGAPVTAVNQPFTSATGMSVVRGGTWTATGGQYVLTAPASGADNGNLAVHTTAVTGDFTLTATATATATTGTSDGFALVFGYRDAANYAYVNLSETNGASTGGVFHVVRGVLTQVADLTTAITAGTAYQLRVERSGTRVRVFLNGAQLVNTADSTFTRGRLGFGSQDDGASFDNLVVTTP